MAIIFIGVVIAVFLVVVFIAAPIAIWANLVKSASNASKARKTHTSGAVKFTAEELRYMKDHTAKRDDS